MMEDARGRSLVIVEMTPPTDVADGPNWRVAIDNGETGWPDGSVQDGRIAEFHQSYVILWCLRGAVENRLSEATPLYS